jgi:hypothetical protein
VGSEGDEYPGADLRKMMIQMFHELEEELKEDIENNSMNPKRTWIKNLNKTQKQLKELKNNFNKF